MKSENLVQMAVLFIIMAISFPLLLGDETIVGDPLETVVDMVKTLFPSLIGIGILLMFLSWAIEQTSFDPLETIITMDLKFWDWKNGYYLPFVICMISLVNLLNRQAGFIISLVFLVITIYRIVQEVSKERA